MKILRILSTAAAMTLLVAWLASSSIAATPAKPLPTVILVHGAFADGSSWDRVVPLLQAKGYPVVALHEPLTSLADDVAATRRAIEQQPGDVVLVGHSYGGAVISEAGNDPKVRSLVYVAAFGLDANESISDLGKNQPPPVWATALRVDKGGYGWLPAATVVHDFAQDLPENEAILLAVKQGPINTKNFDEKLKVAAWHSKPVWYLRASQDHMIDPAAQLAMAKRMNATLTSVPTSHVPMLTRPQDVATIIMTAATTARPTLARR